MDKNEPVEPGSQEAKEGELQVLVLDDEPIVGKNLQIILKKLGLLVEIFVDPTVAMRRIDEHRFDIVITDVVMGEMDGIQVLGHVMKKWPDCRVIIVTAFAQMSLARKAMERGAFDFIAKPFDADQVRQVVTKAVESIRSTPK
jgi:DNA-binding NtrC family response regulator